MLIKAAREPAALPFAGSCIINEAGTRPSLVLIYYCDFAFVEVVLKNYLLTYLFACCFDYTTVLWLQPILFLFTYAAKIEYVSVPSYVSFKNRIRRGVVPLRHVPPQYCDCGPDWPLLFKVHEI